MKKKFPLYRIEWWDAKSQGGWKSLAKAGKEIEHLTVFSAGWLVAETKEYWLLAQQTASVGTYSDTIQIPKTWVKSIKKIKGVETGEIDVTEN